MWWVGIKISGSPGLEMSPRPEIEISLRPGIEISQLRGGSKFKWFKFPDLNFHPFAFKFPSVIPLISNISHLFRKLRLGGGEHTSGDCIGDWRKYFGDCAKESVRLTSL